MGTPTSSPDQRQYVGVIEVYFHLGELYFWAPVLASLEFGPGERVCLLFTSEELHKQFLADPLLSHAIANSPVDVVLVGARYPRHGNLWERGWSFLKRLVMRPWLRKRLMAVLDGSDRFFAQIAGGQAEKLLRGRRTFTGVVRFPHTSSAQIMDADKVREHRHRMLPPDERLLLLDPEAVPYYEAWGVEHPVVLGHHALAPRWLELAREVAGGSGGHAVIFSFAAREDMLPRKDWEQLHRTAVAGIRSVYGDIPIVIKPHPNQDARALRAFVRSNRWKGVEVRTDHPLLVSLDAVVGVGFLTGGLYNTMQLDIPSINFFASHDVYAQNYGAVIVNWSALGAGDADNEEEFFRLLRQAKSGELTTDFGTRKRSIPLITSWAELERAIDA